MVKQWSRLFDLIGLVVDQHPEIAVVAIRVADDGVKDDHILQCVHKRFSQGIIIRFDRWHPALFHKLPNRHISPTIQSDLVELSIREFLKYCDFDVEDYSRFVRHSKVPV